MVVVPESTIDFSPRQKGEDRFSAPQDTVDFSPKPDTSKLTFYAGQGATAEQQRKYRVYQAQLKTGLPPEFIDRNLDAVEQEVTKSDFDAARYRQQSPAVAGWLAEHPDHFVLAREDLSRLSYVERQLRNIKNQYATGGMTTELSRIGTNAMLGTITPAERARQERIELDMSLSDDGFGITGFLEGIPGSVANQVPIFGQTMKVAGLSALAGGLAAAGAAGLAGQAGPQAATPEEVVTMPAAFAGGAISGWKLGSTLEAARMEAGLAYLDYEKLTDENGAPLSREVALGAALITGAINGGLESLGFHSIAEKIPGLRQMTRGGVRQLLAQPTMRGVIANVGRAVLGSATAEGGTEFLQEIVSNGVGDLATKVQDGTINSMTAEDIIATVFSPKNLEAATAAGIAGAQAGGGMALGGSTASLAGEVAKVRQAQRNAAVFEAIGGQMKDAKIAQNLPTKTREAISRITANGPVETVYLPIDSFTTYWQEKGVDPREVAREITGSNAAYDEAIASKSDLAVKTADYAAKIAPTDHNGFFAKELRTDPLAMNANEADAFIKSLDEAEKAGAGEQQAQPDAVAGIQSNIAGQLKAAAVEPRTADAYATLVAQTFGTLAQRTGGNAQELFDKYSPRIVRQILGEESQPGRAAQFGQATVNAILKKAVDQLPSVRDSLPIDQIADQINRPLSIHPEEFNNMSPEDKARMTKAGFQVSEEGAQAWRDAIGDQAFEQIIQETLNPASRPIEDFVSGVLKEPGLFDPNVVLAAHLSRRMAELGPEAQQQARRVVSPAELKTGETVKVFSEDATVEDAEGGRVLKIGSLSMPLDQLTVVPVDVGESFNQGDAKPPTDSVEFKKWFGKSKVVDADGQPLVVYHGTGASISEFSFDFTNQGNDQLGSGFYFTTRESEAESYMTRTLDGQDEKLGGSDNPNVISAYLSIQKPLDADGVGDKITLAKVRKLIEISPNKEVALADWGDVEVDGEAAVIREAAAAYTSEGKFKGETLQALFKIATDFYRGNVQEFNEAVRDVLGYDGVVKHFQDRDHWVAFFPTQIKSVENHGTFNPDNPNIFYQDSSDNKRGKFTIGPDRKVDITLLEKADLSTFLHETGHFYLEILGDIASQKDAPQQIKDDYAKLLEWFGVKSRKGVKVEQHEQFARAFEAYLMEGKAPNAELRSLFSRFKAWLLLIYRKLSALNVNLTDEVRGVFDRLIASDEQIAAAQAQQNIKPVFLDAKAAGMSDEEFAAYSKAVEAQRIEAEQQLSAKLMNEVSREQKAWWKDRKAEVTAQVTADIDKQPIYIALAHLQQGKLPDGSPLPEGRAAYKLNRAAIVNSKGELFLKSLPKPYIYSAEGGVHPDQAAQEFGFESGDQLLTALAESKPRKRAIAEQVKARMMAEYGDIRTDGTMAVEAMIAVHNDRRSDLLMLELSKLAASTKNRVAPLAIIKQNARRIITEKKVRDIRPEVYQRAEAKAAKAAFEAAAKGDLDKAFAEKQKELLNHELYRSATEAREQSDKIAEHMRSLAKDAARTRLGKAGADYLAQIDDILERFEFAVLPFKKLDRRKSLAQWIKEKEESSESNHEEISVSDTLLDESRRVNFKELPYGELQAIRDTVKQIETMASLKNRMLASAKKRDREQVKGELLAALEANMKKGGPQPLTKHDMTTGEQVGGFFATADAALLKTEQLVEFFDGGNIQGPWHEYLWNGASDAQTAEYDYSAKITEKIATAVMAMPKSIRNRLMDKVHVTGAGLDRAVSRKTMIGIALNVGNESNLDKMMRGQGWSMDQINAILDHLTEEEWAFVRSIWATLETMYPEIEALQKELTGLPPEKVEPRMVQTKFGEFIGGYYPLMYDSTASVQGKQQEVARVGHLSDDNYVRATTPKGHTKKRVEGFAAPFNFDFDSLPAHIAGVVKDLTHRKWSIDANWIISDREIRAAIRDHMGAAYVRRMEGWVKQVINDRNVNNSKSIGLLSRFLEQARSNAMIVGLGYKVATILSQFAGFFPAIEAIGGKDVDGHKWLAKGLGDVTRRPFKSYEFITNVSGEMRHRFETRDRDFRDKLKSLEGRTDLLGEIQRVAFFGIGVADSIVSMSAWLGAYKKAIASGLDEDSAIRSGDRAVRLSQGASGAKDLSAIVASKESWLRLVTMFYTPFSALYARLRSIGHDFGGVKDLPKTTVRLFWTWLVSAALTDLLSGRGPDDDEGWAEWMAKEIALYPIATLPMVRDVLSSVVNGYAYQFTPIARVGTETANALKTAGGVVTGDKDMTDLAGSLYKASGYWFGLPIDQLNITGGFLMDLHNGDRNPENLGEFMHGLLFREKK